MSSKFDEWPWKTTGHLLYTTSSFVHHLKAMGEFKLKLQSGNAQFGSKSMIFCPVWLCKLTDDLEKQCGTFSILHKALCIISKPWVNWNWSYSWETLNSGQNWLFLFLVTLWFDRWPWKTIGHLVHATSGSVHYCVAIGEFNLESQSRNAQFGSKSTFFVP